MFGQYPPREWLSVLVTARVRKYLDERRSFGEELAAFKLAFDRGWGLRREGRHNVIEHHTPEVGGLTIRLRRGTSDFAVYQQCLIECHYRLVAHLARHCLPAGGPATVVDGGANIGMSALFFARSFPSARIWCLEPDPHSRAMCQRNLIDNGLVDIAVLEEALWSNEQALALHEDFRDGRSWSVAVRPSRGGASEPTVRSVGIAGLLERTGLDRLDLLKLDIEGAEAAVFEDPRSVDGWLPRIALLAIEVHAAHTKTLILEALARHEFSTVRDGELLIAARRPESDRMLAALRDAAAPSPG